MIALPILHGCCTIQLYKKGDIVVGNTLVDEAKYYYLKQWKWGVVCPSSRLRSYVVRKIGPKTNRASVYMAREVLGLPRQSNKDEVDHKKHDLWDNTFDGVRIVTRRQNMTHRRMNGTKCRFQGVSINGPGYCARVYDSGKPVIFKNMVRDVDAALMYNYGADLVYGEHTQLNVILDDEMPTEERQWELYGMVIERLREKKVLFDESRVAQR